ncbi:hypothetical protein ACEQ8H_006396 [Pleosporales sp. CAS-2024a]
MAAAAHVMRKLDAPATDDIMDLNSDNGIDLNDGDIDLDIDPAPDDDDVSLIDAGALEAQNTQSTSADQDDYMIEDYDDGDLQLEDAMDGDISISDTIDVVPVQEHAPAPVQQEEDLIDYSDDEDDYQQPNTTQQSPAQTAGQTPTANHIEPVLEAASQVHEHAQVLDTTNEEGYIDHAAGEDYTNLPTAGNERHDENEHEVRHEAEYDTDGDTGGVPLQDDETPTNASDHQQGDDDDDQPPQTVDSRTITVNYEGNELWLFHQHDYEGSGDWFLDDASLLYASLSDIFQALRVSLSGNVTNDIEIGLRFDHFHNMEVFEDNPVCVAVSLGRLLDLYHTLQAQDGESEPESFYVCLLSRPRFAALVSDVAKYAEQGHGYSGFNNAVAAGKTHFLDSFSVQSTEHEGTEWDQKAGQEEEYSQEEQGQGGGENAGHAATEVENEEHEGHNEEETTPSPVEQGLANEEIGPKSVSPATGATLAVPSHSGSSPAAQASPDDEEETSQHDSAATRAAEQLANDTVDYSDDEDAEPQASAPAHASPSSVTVQGDNSAPTDTCLPAAEPGGNDEQYQGAPEDAIGDAEDGGHDDFALNEYFDHGDKTESYEEWNQAYYASSGLQEDPSDGYHAEAEVDGLTNQDQTGYEVQGVDQDVQNDKDFVGAVYDDGTDAGESADTRQQFADGDDIVGVENGAEWGSDAAANTEADGVNIFIPDEEEEDGVVEQPAVAASSAANPVAASSTDVPESSPQGQKRRRDEASDVVGEALDMCGMLDPHAVEPWLLGADMIFADSKRPRV